MLVKLRRLQNRLNREHIWDNLKTTASYEVVVFNKITKSSTATPFTDLKQAFTSIYPDCKTQYNYEFYIFRKDGDHKDKYLKFCPYEA